MYVCRIFHTTTPVFIRSISAPDSTSSASPAPSSELSSPYEQIDTPSPALSEKPTPKSALKTVSGAYTPVWKRKTSDSSSSAPSLSPSPLPRLPSLSTDQLTKRVTNTIDEYFNVYDQHEVHLCLQELLEKSDHAEKERTEDNDEDGENGDDDVKYDDTHPIHQFVKSIIIQSFERQLKHRELTCKLISYLYEHHVFNASTYYAILVSVMEGIHDLCLDNPKIYQHLIYLLSDNIITDILSIGDIIELYQLHWRNQHEEQTAQEDELDIPNFQSQVVDVLAAIKQAKSDEFLKQKLQIDIELFVEIFDTPEDAILALQSKGLDA